MFIKILPSFLKGKEWDPILNAKEKEEERIRQEQEAKEDKLYQQSKKKKFVPRNNYQQKVNEFSKSLYNIPCIFSQYYNMNQLDYYFLISV